MNKEIKIMTGIIVAIAIIVVGGFVSIYAMSGLEFPLSTVMSSSMQHDNDHSQIGVIDTGDVMVVFDKDRVVIESYVEGTIDGHQSFGDYGSVIVYERNKNTNPVIHRAIVWVDYNGDGTWSIPSLAEYKGEWSCTSGTDYNKLQGTLTFKDITQSKKTCSINLDSLSKNSGYLTMGDNPVSNRNFDQATGIVNRPIDNDSIRSIPVMELPWWGVVKVYFSPEKQSYLSHVPNSIVSFVMVFIMIFAFIYCSDFYYTKKRTEELKKEIISMKEDSPTPPFPLENEKEE